MFLSPNTSFSLTYEGLQLAWDSTSLGALKKCPRYYELTILSGWTPKRRSIHLDFGLWLHAARERYYHAKSAGTPHDEALDLALEYVMVETWDKKLNRPWISDDPNKNRFTLVRTLVWYLDRWQEDPLKTVELASGKPAVELTFAFDTAFKSLGGETYKLCGHLDRVVTFNDITYGSDLKSTKDTISKSYFDGFSPDNQMSLYSVALRHFFNLNAQGIILDVAQVAVSFSRFQRGMIQRTEEQLSEWWREFGQWLAIAEMYARNKYWPMNDKACFRCEFRGICSKPKSVREMWLKVDFEQRIWDPLQRRGDI